MTFVYLMENVNLLNKDLILAHVNYLKKLDGEDKLVLCGPFSDYAGGMVVVECKDRDEAKHIADNDPFIASGCKSYQIRTIEVANKDNNYGLTKEF